MFREQFFGKPFLITFAGLAAYFGLAILVYKTPFTLILLGITALVVFSVSMKRMEWGIFIAMAELFGNSHGHLVDASVGGIVVSLRMAVFAAVMAAWAVHAIRGRHLPFKNDQRLFPFLLLAAAVLMGFVRGFGAHTPMDAFQDGNAYMYLAYALPIAGIVWNPSMKRELLQIFMAAAAWMAAVTLGLLYVFTHLSGETLVPIYKFIRDTRTGELTQMDGGLFRVFLQGQFSVAVAALVAFALMLWQKGVSHVRSDRRIVFAAFVTIVAALLISQSRSFWTGLVPAIACVLGLYLYIVRPKMKLFVRQMGFVALADICGLVVMVAILLFPIPYRAGSFEAFRLSFSDRTTNLGDVAISSRWNLLPELMEEIKEQPILGKGFGEEVAFVSDDPRVRAIYPDGKWRTYSLEWGWLDLWLKMGLLGPVCFAVAHFLLGKMLYARVREPEGWLHAGLIASLVFLAATHVFSPYLNHPLGLGLLLLIIPFINRNAPRVGARAEEVEVLKVPAIGYIAPIPTMEG